MRKGGGATERKACHRQMHEAAAAAVMVVSRLVARAGLGVPGRSRTGGRPPSEGGMEDPRPCETYEEIITTRAKYRPRELLWEGFTQPCVAPFFSSGGRLLHNFLP